MLALLLLSALSARAADAPRFFALDDGQIAVELKKIHKDNPDLQKRVEAVSAAFLGTPYKLGPLGEGENGRFDREPLYSFKQVDCTTVVEQVMALALTPDLNKALRGTLQRIRYKNGEIGYATRNHFPETDWLPNNEAAGFLKDVTREIAGAKAKSVSKLISKRDWYLKKTLDDIQGFPPETSQAKREDRLKELQALASSFQNETSTIPFLPMDSLPELLPRIPSGTIASLVREDKPDKPLVVSHQVLLIDKEGVKFVRHANANLEVMDAPALEYFYKFYNSSWRLVGLNLSRLREPGKP